MPQNASKSLKMPEKVLENLKNPVKTVKTHNTLKQVKTC